MHRKLKVTYGLIAASTLAMPVLFSKLIAQTHDDHSPHSGHSQLAESFNGNRNDKVKKLVERIKESESDDNAKATLRNELMQELLGQFSRMEAERKQQIEVIEKRIQTVKATLETRAQNAEKIVEGRIAQLLGEPSTMSWDYSIPDERQILGTKALRERYVEQKFGFGKANNPLQAKGTNFDISELDSKAKSAYQTHLALMEDKKAELAKRVGEINKDLAERAKEIDERVAREIVEGKLRFGDPTLRVEYSQAMVELQQSKLKVLQLTESLENQKRELAALEKELLPMQDELKRAYREFKPTKPASPSAVKPKEPVKPLEPIDSLNPVDVLEPLELNEESLPVPPVPSKPTEQPAAKKKQ